MSNLWVFILLIAPSTCGFAQEGHMRTYCNPLTWCQAAGAY